MKILKPKSKQNWYFDWVVAEVHSVDGASRRIEVGRGFQGAELELDAHAARINLDARRSDISEKDTIPNMNARLRESYPSEWEQFTQPGFYFSLSLA